MVIDEGDTGMIVSGEPENGGCVLLETGIEDPETVRAELAGEEDCGEGGLVGNEMVEFPKLTLEVVGLEPSTDEEGEDEVTRAPP
jgi:hypothetical protein